MQYVLVTPDKRFKHLIKLLRRRPDQQRQENEKEEGEEDLIFLRKKEEVGEEGYHINIDRRLKKKKAVDCID